MTARKIRGTMSPTIRPILVSLLTVLICLGMGLPAYPLRDRDYASRRESGERHLERLRRIMIPLLRATDHPDRLKEIRVKIVDDPHINAGTAGGGQFLVTTALLQKASDEQLRGVLAHEIAHDDLGHPAKVQLVGAGIGVGAALLEQFFPGSGAVTPLAGTLIATSYTRPQELAADRHAVTILRRAGYSKNAMIEALTWIVKVEGNSGGGLLSTHPATNERIQTLRRM